MIIGVDPACGEDRAVFSFAERMSDGTLVVTPCPLAYQPRDDQELIGLAELAAVGKFPPFGGRELIAKKISRL